MAGTEAEDGTDEEFWAMLSASKGEPFTREEWESHVERLERDLTDARLRLLTATRAGHCKASRFG